MSLLFPLYLGGLLAVGLPIVFHMIRRTPSGQRAFGSLMFLRKSPPRLVRRKRVEHLALLCLRALLLILLAVAFARPYLRGESRIAAAASDEGRVALVIDTSASMRRAGAWEAALREARDVLAGVDASSTVAMYGFDDELRPVAELSELTPTWGGSDCGLALVETAERLASERTSDEGPATIVLISDLQRGSGLTELEGYDWPPGIQVDLRRVEVTAGNAGLHPGPVRARAVGDDELRVRVSNAANSASDRFALAWRDPSSQAHGEELTVFCPPGETRDVRAPARPAVADLTLALSGDRSPFDNVLYTLPVIDEERQVLSYGCGGADQKSLDFFLGNVFGEDSDELDARGIERPTALDPRSNPMVVLNAAAGGEADAGELLAYAEGGGVLLVVLAAGDDASVSAASDLVGALLEAPDLALEEAPSSREFALLAEVDFSHPLFAPFADPRFSDFTKIHFWGHRRVATTSPQVRVLARFDDGDPFLLERRHGAGSILLATSGWEPADSDLARSSKFAPLLAGMSRLARRSDLGTGRFRVGDVVPLNVAGMADGRPVTIHRPDGSRFEPEAGVTTYVTEMPGQYELVAAGRSRPFSVHLDPAESRTAPLEREAFTVRDVPVARNLGPAAEEVRAEHERQELGHELEGRQKLWRWLLLAAVAGLLIETTWAGRLARRVEAEVN